MELYVRLCMTWGSGDRVGRKAHPGRVLRAGMTASAGEGVHKSTVMRCTGHGQGRGAEGESPILLRGLHKIGTVPGGSETSVDVGKEETKRGASPSYRACAALVRSN